MITLSIIIVNYNVKEFLEQTLLSVQKAATAISHEIFVVDNASSDGSVEMLHQKFPHVRVIANKVNHGFAAANNQALKLAQGEFILVLNPDTVVQEDTFQLIINYMKSSPECGMVGCKILNPDGSLQLACRRSFPTPWVGFTRIIGLSRLFPKSKFFGRYNLTYLNPDETCEVEAISGSFMFLRKQVMDEIGYFDESFFMYGEDLDWCYRIHQAGWKIVYLPETKIIHFKGESSKKARIDLTMQFYRAMQLFVEKHYQSRYFHLPQWFLVSGIFLRAGLTYLGQFFIYIIPIIIDTILLNVSLILALLIRFGNLIHLHSYLIVTLIYSTVWLICLGSTGVYTRKRMYSLRAAVGVLAGFFINTSMTFFFNQYAFSRAVVIIAALFNVFFLSGWRFFIKLIPRLDQIISQDTAGNALMGRRTLIVGTGNKTRDIINRLRHHVEGGYHIYGLITPEETSNDGDYSNIPVLGTIHDLDRIIQTERIQEVIFSSESISYDHILELMTRTRRKGVTFKLVPSTMEVIIGKASIDRIDALPLVDIDYALDRPMSKFVKRSIDILLAGLILICTSPFYMWKRFIKRNMLVVNSYHAYQKPVIQLASFAETIKRNRWRRLPHLWSVIKGDISLVGSSLEKFSSDSSADIILKPGLFGLSQLQKSSNLTDKEKEQYDLYYLKNYTPLLDVEIILKSLINK
ncbi:glycosyltransferase [candidate division KSB1 bacterium]|nr:glycosyltransferase [candidate division KSB1 bacterium]